MPLSKIKELKKELGLSNKDLAEFFGMGYGAYANSSAKKRYENALCLFYAFVKKQSAEGENIKTASSDNVDLNTDSKLNMHVVNNFYNEHTAKEELKELMHWYDDQFDKIVKEVRDEKAEQQYDDHMESDLKEL